MFGRSFAR